MGCGLMEPAQKITHQTNRLYDSGQLSTTIQRNSKLAFAILVVVMISLNWITTSPLTKAEGNSPVAVIGVFYESSIPFDVPFGQEWDAPYLARIDGDDHVDIVIWKKASYELYVCLYQQNDSDSDYYECFPFLDFSAILGDSAMGGPVNPLKKIIITMADVNNDGEDRKDIVITNVEGTPKLFINTGEFDPYTNIPQFDYLGDFLPLDGISKAYAPNFADLDGDGDQDMICANAALELVFYNGTGNLEFALQGNISDVNNDPIPDMEDLAGLMVLPHLVDYDGDCDHDLFVSYGTEETHYTTVYYNNTGNMLTPEWTPEPLPFLAFINDLDCKYLGMANLNDEMTGLTGRSHGDENDNRLEFVGKSLGSPELRCFFQEFLNSDGTLSVSTIEGKRFELSGEFSYDPDGAIESYSWDFGDGSEHETNPSVSHTYAEVDGEFDGKEERYKNFTITFVVADNETNTDEIRALIRVYDSCPRPVITGPKYPAESRTETYNYRAFEESVVYEGDPINITAIQWDTSYNESDGFQANPDYTGMSDVNISWDDDGAECIALKLLDNDGSEAMEVMNILVLNQKPSCGLSLDPTVFITENEGGDGAHKIYKESDFPDDGVMVYAFNDTDPGNDELTEYRWYVRRGRVAVSSHYTTTTNRKSFTLGNEASDEFSNSGEYVIKAKVKDEDGAWSDYSNEVFYTIEDERPSSASISVLPDITEADEGMEIGFSPTSIQTPFDVITRYEWDFDYSGNETAFQTDAVSYPDDDTGSVTHGFEVNDGASERDFNVGLRVVDADGSLLTTSLYDDGYGNITIHDTGFNDGGELYVVSDNYNSSIGIAEGEALTFELRSLSTIYDPIVVYHWDFDHDGTFTDNPAISSSPTITHPFTTFRRGTENDTTMTCVVAVKAIDADGSESSVIQLENITINDISPSAAFNGTDFGHPLVPMVFDASPSTFSPMDGNGYEWDFSYDGETFTPEPPDEDLTGDGRVISKAFDEGKHTIALRVSETIKDSDNEYSIAEMSANIEEKAAANLRITEMNSPECIFSVEENEEFKLDGTLSTPDPGDDTDYYWSYEEGVWHGPTSEKIFVVENGLSANESIVWKYFDEDEKARPCQIYTIKLKLTQKSGYTSTAERTLYVKDAQPDAPIAVDKEHSSPVVEVVDGIVYTAPGATVRFTATEADYYIDSPVRYLWKQDYVWKDDRYLGEPQSAESSVDFSWGIEGRYTVAVKKKDADESVVGPQYNTITVVVTKDTDGDGILDIFDFDDDDDGVYDSAEVHTKVFETEYTYPIRWTYAGGGKHEPVVVRLEDVEASGDILSAKAHIKVSHSNMDNDIHIYLCSSGKQYSVYTGQDVSRGKFHDSLDLLDLRDDEGNLLFRPDDFNYPTPWELHVFDYDSHNDGAIDYFKIAIVHTSDPLDIDKDTDDDKVTDYEELNFGNDGYITDPCDSDTDDDGWSDYKEIHEECTNPASPDTDGDGVWDTDDLDPHHDVMLKLDIYRFQRRHSKNDDVYFRGNIGNRKFTTDYILDPGCSERYLEKNGKKLGVFYYPIDDSREIAKGGIGIKICAMDYEKKGSHKQLDCAGSNAGEAADFTYYPDSGEISPVHTNDIEWCGVSDDRSRSFVLLNGNTDEGVRVWLNISKTYTDKINTILIANESTLVNNSNGECRYMGEDKLIVFHIKNSLTGGNADIGTIWQDVEHVILVPESVFIMSKFADDLESGNRALYNITRENSDFLKRKYENPWPRQAETVIELRGTDAHGEIPVTALLENLTMTSQNTDGSDVKIAERLYLKPYSYLCNDDCHADLDRVHSIGLPKGILDIIPNAGKSTESESVKYKIREDNIWAEYAEDFLDDLENFWNEKMEDFLDVVYHNSFFCYNTAQIRDPASFEMQYHEKKEYDLTSDFQVLSSIAQDIGFFVSSLDEGVINLNFPTSTPYINKARNAYDRDTYTDFVRYPSFGSPQIMTTDENLVIYVKETRMGDASEWEVLVRDRVTADKWPLMNLEVEDPNPDEDKEYAYGKISGTIPPGVEDNRRMYDIIVKRNGITQDIELHSLQLIEEYTETPKFAQITDIHIGEVGAEHDFVKLISKLNSDDDLDFVILTGDITHGSQIQGDLLGKGLDRWWDMTYLNVETEWKVAWYLLQKLDMPVYVTPGNHDYYDDAIGGADEWGWIDEKLTYFHKYLLPEFRDKVVINEDEQYREADPNDYSFDYSEYHFVSVNSGKPKDANRLEVVLDGLKYEQVEWMKADYAGAGKKHTFVFTHAPVVSDHNVGLGPVGKDDWTHENPNDYYFVQWIVDESPNLEVVFCGHTHERNNYNNIYIEKGKKSDDSVNDNYIKWSTQDYARTFSYDFRYNMLVTELG